MTATATTPTLRDSPRAARRKEKRKRFRAAWKRPETKWAYIFLSPWIIGFLAFTAGPMIWSLFMSFQQYDAINPPKWVGLANYNQLLHDPQAHRALLNTLVYAAVHVPLSIIISLALALLLNQVKGRMAGIFRTIFYLPAMTPTVAVGTVFLLLLNGNNGVVNEVLSWFGISGPSWTSDPRWILAGIILMSLWMIGSTVIILFAALRDVPGDLYEAARLDGASWLRQQRSVTVPMISGTLFFLVIVNSIAALQMFSEVYTMYYGTTMTSETASDASLTYVIYIFREGFNFFNMGYASALAWVLFIIVFIITMIQTKLADRFVYYEGADR